MFVRAAHEDEIDYIADLSRRVQERLTASGSLQIIGPIPRETVATYVRAGHALLLVEPPRLLGSVFIEPVARETFLALARWRLVDPRPAYWFLQKLMLEPDEQGRGLGASFLDSIKAHVAAATEGPGEIVLDCWAGNDNLRAFYTRNGFTLHGVFGEGDYEIAVFTLRSSPGPPSLLKSNW